MTLSGIEPATFRFVAQHTYAPKCRKETSNLRCVTSRKSEDVFFNSAKIWNRGFRHWCWEGVGSVQDIKSVVTATTAGFVTHLPGDWWTYVGDWWNCNWQGKPELLG